MAETAGDSAQVDSSRQELGSRVVPQGVNMRVDAEAFGHVLVATGDGVRRIRLARIEVVHSGKDIHIVSELDPEISQPLLATVLMLAEQHDGLRVERDPAHLVRLGVLLLAHAAPEQVATPDLDQTLVQIDTGPPERT